MGCENSKCGTAESVKTTLFKKCCCFTYRIPSLLYLPGTRTYLAFAEKRRSSKDVCAKCLMIRRMTTNVHPTEWSPPKELYKELMITELPNHRNMNPCPVYDSTTQTVFLFYISVPCGVTEREQIDTGRNQARLCCVSSSDQGATWEAPRDLTVSVMGEIRVSTLAVGPGHGVQLDSGRLVVPAYAYLPQPGKSESRAFSIYSDDGGSLWQMGKQLDSWSNECEVAEVFDGAKSVLCCNARTRGSRRVEAQSTDGGDTFQMSPETSMLVETGTNGCQGSIIAFPAPNQPEGAVRQTWLAFSHPTNQSFRRDLGMSLNRTPLQSHWDPPKVIHRGPSGYSDLAYSQEDQRFSCLLECGEKSELEQIAFMSFTLDEIRQTSS
ncbi:sialidase-3-like [Gadus chalcogrammus]|uniref:sialidase-3-like n=1 Tax=Gadus chalcogrammus TaxID=1042646 RepID=UPI0024C3E9CC|nr:sialidase-3-like [Gadus chalcogrammus]